MIGKLKGKIDYIGEDKLVLDVNGVGYNIYASAKAIDVDSLSHSIPAVILHQTR